jgi:ABC-type dipeptide/oligopeptide/nickel transport system ATPase subunit
MRDLILKADGIFYSVDKKNNYASYNTVEILKNISFEVERKKIIGISGESGSGKSTLAKILAGIYSSTSGQIEKHFKRDWTNQPSKPIQLLFQNDGNLINPNRKVKDILYEAFELTNKTKKDYSAEVNEVFNNFGLKKELLNSKASQLSGGEQQRIALARIIIVNPEVLILDEPFSSQDVEAQLTILNLIKKIKTEFDLTVICISHNLKVLQNLADEILIMFNGKIIESGITADIFSNPKNEYTKFLINAQSLKLSKEEIFSFHSNYEQDQRNKNY